MREAASIGHAELAKFREMNGFGRAIAAPQFGYNIRLICLIWNGVAYSLFNPVIKSKSISTFMMWDDCFSIPDTMVSVRRHEAISVEFQDESGSFHIWNLPKDMSELLQHEIDHLDGVLSIDVATPPIYGECAEKLCRSTVSRSEWMKNRDKYDRQVDPTKEEL